MKKYFVLMTTKKYMFEKETDSLRVAEFFAKLGIWKYAKIHERIQCDVCYNGYDSKCIYVNDKRA